MLFTCSSALALQLRSMAAINENKQNGIEKKSAVANNYKYNLKKKKTPRNRHVYEIEIPCCLIIYRNRQVHFPSTSLRILS